MGASASVAGLCPVPESGTVCVPRASTTVRMPLLTPEELGAKTTPTVQLSFAANDAVQVLVEMEKSPVAVSLVRVVATSPVLAMLTYCAADLDPTVVVLKVSDDGVRTTVAGARPVPESAAVICPPVRLPKMVSSAVRGPVCEGLKVTETWQELWSAID